MPLGFFILPLWALCQALGKVVGMTEKGAPVGDRDTENLGDCWWFHLFGGPIGGKQVEDDQIAITGPPLPPCGERGRKAERSQAHTTTKG